MRGFLRFLGLPAVAAVLISGLNLAPVYAQSAYPSNGHKSGGSHMTYRAPRSRGSAHRTAPKYQAPKAKYSSSGAKYGGSTRYVVRWGDTLAHIAARFGVSQSALLRANPAIRDRDVIYAGQVLVIPSRSSGSYGNNGNNAYGTSDDNAYGQNNGYHARGKNNDDHAYGQKSGSNSYGKNNGNNGYDQKSKSNAYGMNNSNDTYSEDNEYNSQGNSGGYNDNASSNPAPAPAPMPAPGPGSQAATVNLTAQNLMFNMSSITVPAGAQVTVNFDNQDAGVPHNFAVYTDSSAQQAIFRGQIITGPDSTSYSFTAPSQPGTYFFRCDVHFTMMTGQFVVR